MATTAPAKELVQEKPKDIHVSTLAKLSWETGQVLDSLDKIRTYADRQAQEAIDWYYRKKGPKATASRALRFLAIFLATFGGLIPIVANLPHMNPAWQLERWGYVMLGVAAACVAFDKFFGFSSGWIRYVVTAQSLQEALCAFRIDWARAESRLVSNPPTAQPDELMQLARDLIVRVLKDVGQETQQWVVEFQSSLADLEKTTKSQLEAARPGSLTINVDNAAQSDVPVAVSIDGVDYGTLIGTTSVIQHIAPGTHAVTVRGQKGGKPMQQSGSALVPAGGVGKLDLHLPSP